mgnify:CR=1 FL=1
MLKVGNLAIVVTSSRKEIIGKRVKIELTTSSWSYVSYKFNNDLKVVKTETAGLREENAGMGWAQEKI